MVDIRDWVKSGRSSINNKKFLKELIVKIARLNVIESIRLTAVTTNLDNLFNKSDLNKKLIILIGAYSYDAGENEPEYMDAGDVMLEDIAIG